MDLKTSQDGIDLIKHFEGCRLQAYKPVSTEKYYTIGYGHYGPDVAAGMTITQAQAEQYLVEDLRKFEAAVNKLNLKLNQNQFDALVSFTYNCGTGNLNKLTLGRTVPQIGEALLLYNKASGKVLAGLTKRREAERALFFYQEYPQVNKPQYALPNGPDIEIKLKTKSLKQGCKGREVKTVQLLLESLGYKIIPDGYYGNGTRDIVKKFQDDRGLVADGVAGVNTLTKLLHDVMVE